MRIVIDMQGSQTESRFRGIGRYTLSFAQAVVRNRGEHEVVLALSGLFPDTIEPLRAAFDGLLPQENIRVWEAPGPVRECEPDNHTRREVAEKIREAFLAALQPDVIHVSSLFEGFVDDGVTSIKTFDHHTPVSVTLYDLIPLTNGKHYLDPKPAYRAYYLRKIDHLKRADRLFGISAYAGQEAVAHLGFDSAHVVHIGTASAGNFKPVTVQPHEERALRERLGLHRPFAFYFSASDERKNHPRLIKAWAQLPESLRQGHQLALAGVLTGHQTVFEQHVRKAGLKPGKDVVILPWLPDEEINLLLNLCKVFVFPSWHEGFGLPVLEAMECGKAVIASNTSSLPEVVGRQDALFDPFDVHAIAQKIRQVLTDDAFRHDLERHALEQANKFNWEQCAQRAWLAWENFHDSGKQDIRRLRQSWAATYHNFITNQQRLIDEIAMLLTSGRHPSEEELCRLAECMARCEQQIESYLRSKPLPKQTVWRIEGPFDSSYSLALVNRETARALESLGHTVVLHSTEGPGDFPANEQFLSQNPDLAEMYARSTSLPQDTADVTSRNLYPPRVADMKCRLNLLHSYGWEESGFPQEWVQLFNQSLQGMTVMSEHVKKVMVDNGVTVPVVVTGIGVDHWERIEPDKRLVVQAKKFRFLHVSSCFPRKGVDSLLQAYGRAFTIHDDVTLIIKTFPNPHNKIHRWLKEARDERPDFPDVLILEGDYTEAQLKALYEQCHALVMPSRAEGFGLPMAEAMISGLPVITTGWGGQLEFCNKETAWLVDYRFEWAKSHFHLFSSVWANPDIEHLAGVMREIYEMPEAQRKARSVSGRRLLLEKFRWVDVAKRLVESARSWACVKDTPTPRIGWVTTWNTRCGIAAYSEHLIRNMPSRVTVLAAHSDVSTAHDQDNVHRCWSVGESDPLDNLRVAVDQLDIDTLVIQFNYGFFRLDTLSEFLIDQIELGRVVVVELHSTTDPVHEPHKKIELMVPALSRCHRLLVHSVNDMNRLKSLGLVDNVALFPHGVIDYVPPAKEKLANEEKLILASYGFFLPHKGLHELIESVAILRDQGLPVELRMINAEYPVPESKRCIEQAKELISTKNLDGIVSICTQYLEDSSSLSRLSEADLIVFPYQNTGESASGAVRHGLASGRPVAVTPLSIFDDVKEVTFRLPGFTPQEIAEGIQLFWHYLLNEDSFALDILKSAERWRSMHRYSVLSPRFYNMLVALYQTAFTRAGAARGVCHCAGGPKLQQ
ncbi:glycosyltransferase [Desulfosoma caldarium]|uniref:Glycosyltransferase involved in cell wall biosynthesis n=1 Tax=Desulfosoma caldarium TaxID=610254 RepID=A0A3N1VK00_9BACT|nr:glycosyltransferase [Desulfosoma caldarium]ROR03146.1 glycosyltransferase involved in cell wall biosynthesis [Desulfosoma caldarium]